jgi:hypothetical protein
VRATFDVTEHGQQEPTVTVPLGPLERGAKLVAGDDPLLHRSRQDRAGLWPVGRTERGSNDRDGSAHLRWLPHRMHILQAEVAQLPYDNTLASTGPRSLGRAEVDQFSPIALEAGRLRTRRAVQDTVRPGIDQGAPPCLRDRQGTGVQYDGMVAHELDPLGDAIALDPVPCSPVVVQLAAGQDIGLLRGEHGQLLGKNEGGHAPGEPAECGCASGCPQPGRITIG